MGINKETVLDLINDLNRLGGFKDYNSYQYLFSQVNTMSESKKDTESRWISVTEATPTEDGDYWCTLDAETGRFTDWCSWYKGEWVVWIRELSYPVSNVVAWCKPMKRMRGDNMRYCRIKRKLCVFATEWGYCSFTVCREVTE